MTREAVVSSCKGGEEREGGHVQRAGDDGWRRRRAGDAQLRCCRNATANNVSVASPVVPTRMLKGGISSSAIFMAGQVRPQARLNETSMTRAAASAGSCVEGLGTVDVPAADYDGGRRQGAGLSSTAGGCRPIAREGVRGGKNARPAGTIGRVAPQLTVC